MVEAVSLSAPTEGIRFQADNIQALVNEQVHGNGTLYVSEQVITWIQPSLGTGFRIPYKKATAHGISRDRNIHSSDCLYILVTGSIDSSEEPSEDDAYEENVQEVKFVPSNGDLLNNMYQAIQDCSLLHPDPEMDDSAEEDYDELFEGQEVREQSAGDEMLAYGIDEAGDIEDDAEDEEIMRLRQFMRMQLHFGIGPGGDGSSNDSNLNGQNGVDGNGNGDSPFNPEQFQDAD